MENSIQMSGYIDKVFADGLVQVIYRNQSKFVQEEFELDDLQFYTGTRFLQDCPAKSILFKGMFVLSVRDNESSTGRSEIKRPRILKLFKDFPHGRVYINRQIQISIINDIKERSRNVLKEKQEALFLHACETGSVSFRIHIPFHSRVLDFLHDKVLPEPETRETLMERSVQELHDEVFIAPSQDQTLQRIKILKIIYGKQLLKVNFIDFGIEEEIKLEQIYSASAIDENYAYFPPLAVKGHLRGIVSLDVGGFEALIQYKQLCIQLIAQYQRDTDTDTSANAPDIKLFAKQNPGGRNIRIEEMIIRQGVGIPEIRKPRYYGLDWLNSIEDPD